MYDNYIFKTNKERKIGIFICISVKMSLENKKLSTSFFSKFIAHFQKEF